MPHVRQMSPRSFTMAKYLRPRQRYSVRLPPAGLAAIRKLALMANAEDEAEAEAEPLARTCRPSISG